MLKRSSLPIALTIAGSDSGGGAGIQADLKTFAALGVHGTCAITCLTAQNPKRVADIQATRPDMVRRQIESVFAELQPAAVKTGMLYSAEIVRVVARFFKQSNRPPLIVDPVMVATSGARLAETAAVKAMQRELLPLATLITPNLDEAAILGGRQLRSVDDMRAAARELNHRFDCAVLVKGGHLKKQKEAVDVYFNGGTELLLKAPFIKGVHTHGTGCTYSAAIAAFLARGMGLTAAVKKAKEHVTQTIAQSRRAGAHTVLNNFWRVPKT